jgi:hypothetical protein
MRPDIPTPTPDTPSEKMKSQEDIDLQAKLFYEEQYKEALRICDIGLQKHPENVKLLATKAIVLNNQDKPTEALEILNGIHSTIYYISLHGKRCYRQRKEEAGRSSLLRRTRHTHRSL